jgi:hypothetical protein
MLKKENSLLYIQVRNLEDLNKNYMLQDSIRINEIRLWRTQAYEYEDINVKLTKKLKIYKKIPYISGGIIAVLLGLIIIR